MDELTSETLTKLHNWATKRGLELDEWLNQQLDLFVRTPAQGVKQGEHGIPAANFRSFE